ncbi:hypothetical protein CM15mP37_10790 [bacterium]|nr:MAG: hypothetical protein CM15mP37_10790 [bacterium]
MPFVRRVRIIIDFSPKIMPFYIFGIMNKLPSGGFKASPDSGLISVNSGGGCVRTFLTTKGSHHFLQVPPLATREINATIC